MSPIRVGILTVSDGVSRGDRQDRSGDRIAEWCREREHAVEARAVVADETDAIVRVLMSWADQEGLDVIVTTGGTGLTRRDVTPEATRAVLDKEAPGVAEAIRRRGVAATPFSVLSRGLAGSRGSTFILNLPGSPGGVADGLEVFGPLAPHVVELLRGEAADHEAPAGKA